MDNQQVQRTKVEIDGVTHLMTDEQIGMLIVECSPEELEAFKLEIAREQGVPEPELYQDELIGMTNQEDPVEELNELIEVQERMAKGMRLITEAQTSLLSVRKRLQDTQKRQIPYQEFVSLIKARKDWETRISLLWDKWFFLKNSVQADSSLWAQYFQLAQEEINRYFTTGDSEDIDEQVHLFQNQNEVADDLRDNHLKTVDNPTGPYHDGSCD